MSENKQKGAVLLHLIGPAGHEIFDTLCDSGDNYETEIASFHSYFMPEMNLMYESYNFLRTKQNSAETTNTYVTALRLLKKSCDYDNF